MARAMPAGRRKVRTPALSEVKMFKIISAEVGQPTY